MKTKLIQHITALWRKLMVVLFGPAFPIRKGDFFTITENLRHPSDHSWQGDCLEAICIDREFIRCREHPCLVGAFTIDSRDFKLRHLSKPFVESCKRSNQ